MPRCLPDDFQEYKKYLESEHFLNWWKNIGLADDESVYGIIPFYDKYCKQECKKLKHANKERKINYCFITLQNFQCRKKDIDKMLLFLKRIDYLYESGEWIIESGKSVNIHIHMLVKIIDAKKHKNKLNIEWNKLFNNNITDKDFYKLTQWRQSKLMPSYEQWVNEKLGYFKNDSKGNHSNLEDLECQGSFSGGAVSLG
jgi:hypothetical protein